jgi:peptidoglycan/LPS O-acetylase OafA/YrhL
MPETLTHTDYITRKNIPALTALRGISVLLVVTVHVHVGSFEWLFGVRGVTIFFIISGYLITFLALREERERGVLNFAAFYTRRTFRIFPVYYFTILIYVALLLWIKVKPDKIANFEAALPYLLTYFQEIPFFLGVNGANDNIPLYQAWSLGIEEKFYLIWPAIAFLALRHIKDSRLYTSLVLAGICAVAPKLLPFGDLLFPYFNILIGCSIALALDDEHLFEKLRPFGRGLPMLIIGFLLIAVHLASPRFSFFPFDGNYDILYSIVAAVLITSIVLSGSIADRVFDHEPLNFIGRLSYTIYLFHVLCINSVEVITTKIAKVPVLVLAPVSLLASILLAIAVSWVIYSGLERPMNRFGHRISASFLSKDKTLASTA